MTERLDKRLRLAARSVDEAKKLGIPQRVAKQFADAGKLVKKTKKRYSGEHVQWRTPTRSG